MCRDYNHRKWVFFKVWFVLAFIAAISLLLMQLWNSLMPLLFGIKAIDYLQAVGLLILSKILFSGVGIRHRYGRHEAWHKKYKQDIDSQPNGSTGE